MQLRTLARDCLYLNWALPLEAAPELPRPLRYEVHEWEDEEWVFVSALLFRITGLHPSAMPFPRLSYPQMNLRLYVFDERGVASVLFLRTLVPFWVVPVSRHLGRQPATAASFSYPDPSDEPDRDSWSWTVERRHRLEVVAGLGNPATGPGPRLGSWERTVEHFSHRRRGYSVWDHKLRPIKTSRPPAQTWPLQVELGEVGLMAECLGIAEAEHWKQVHSAWLSPEIPFVFELGKLIDLPVPTTARVPAPEAG
jgi:hypothetical protein